MAIARQQAVLSTVPSGMRPLDIANEVRNIRPAQTTILTLLMGLNKVKAESREFKINEQAIDPGTVTATALAANVFTVSTDDVKFVRIGQTLLLNHTTNCLVTGVNYTTGAVTVDDATGFSATSVLILGSVGHEELSARPTAVSRIPTQTTNYCETARDAYGESRWVQTEKHYGGPRKHHNREICMWEHKRFVDRGLWFSKKLDGTQNSQKLYKTNGILRSITTNIRTFSATTVTWDKMRANITTDTRFSLSPSLWLSVPRKGLELLEKIVRDKTVPMTYTEAAGIKVGNVGMGNKTLKIFVIDHFEQGLDDTWILIDPELIEIVTTKDQVTGQRQWMIEELNVEDPGTDGTINVLTSDFGCRLHNEQAHAAWDGAASAA